MSRSFDSIGKNLPGASAEAALRRIACLATELEAAHIAESARSYAERAAEGLFYVTCIGQFKRGKSTLLNALVGRNVLPVGIVPVTTIPTILRHGDRPAARVRFRAADWKEVPLESVDEYVSEDKNPENRKGVQCLEIFLPSPLLASGMCLVDTPGLGSVFSGNTAATHAFIPHIDAALVVIGADPPLSGEELQFVEIVAQEVRDLLIVLNKADRVGETERSQAAAFARRVLESRLHRAIPGIYEVSALERVEERGAERDWPKLLEELERLRQHSGRALGQKAAHRGLRRSVCQLLGVVEEERRALQRPVEESERRIAELHKTFEQAENARRDLGALLTMEQQRLAELFAERRKNFLRQAQGRARDAFGRRLSSVAKRWSGPAYRRDVMHLAQEIARRELLPWLQEEQTFAVEAFGRTTRRFVELGNDFLHRLPEIGAPELEDLPADLDPDAGLRADSQFQFHVIERVAAPASPFIFLSDLLLGAVGFRKLIVRDAVEFLGQLLEVNSARVQSDVEERVPRSAGAAAAAALAQRPRGRSGAGAAARRGGRTSQPLGRALNLRLSVYTPVTGIS